MSLLMDALKKAELAKRKAQSEGAPPSSRSSAVSSPTDTPSPMLIAYGADQTSIGTDSPPAAGTAAATNGASLPSLSEPLELLDREFETVPLAGTAFEPPQADTPADNVPEITSPSLDGRQISPGFREPERTPVVEHVPPSAGRESVQNLFDTKRTEGTAQSASSRKLFGIVVGGATLLALIAIGVYFWLELQPKSSLQAASLARVARPVEPVAPLTEASPPVPAAIPGLVAPSDPNDVAPEKNKPKPAAEIAEQPTATANREEKKLFRVNAVAPASNQTLDRAYDALTRGDNSSAKAAYEQALANDPKNPDALAGLAVVAQRAGNAGLAADYYLQMLDADPKNAIAMAGLINLQSDMDPAVAETRLKQALANQPDSPALNFSLGNIYARRKRWVDAQQAYFKTVSGDPTNPDYLFNLAISLDQLHQPRLAAKYYADAIAAAALRPAAFDKTQANERILKLQQP